MWFESEELLFTERYSVKFILPSSFNEDLTCYHEVEADPSEDLDPVVVINAEEVHENKADGYEHPHKADGEEKLCGNEECWKQYLSLVVTH